MSLYKGDEKDKIAKLCGVERFILTLMCTGHVGSRWYTPDFRVVTIDIYAFIPPLQQSLYLNTTASLDASRVALHHSRKTYVGVLSCNYMRSEHRH